MWAVKHKSGTVLFVTNCERTANNRREMGWIVGEVKMTSREQFEKWATNAGFIVTTKNDGYLYPATNSAWQTWQASRAAIEIQVCSCPNDHGPHVDDHYREQINNAGLKVKK